MQTYWRLSHSVTACVATGRVIFLDVARDRYSAVPTSINEAFAGWLQLPDSANPPKACQSMIATLLHLSPEASTRVRPTAVRIDLPDWADIESLPTGSASARKVARAIRVVLATRRRLQRSSLSGALQHCERILSRARGAGATNPRQRAADFRAVRHWVPAKQVCLLDSLSIVDWLGAAASDVQLVLGVKALPFEAHCWVQHRGRLLDDFPDNVARYTPILHVG